MTTTTSQPAVITIKVGKELLLDTEAFRYWFNTRILTMVATRYESDPVDHITIEIEITE